MANSWTLPIVLAAGACAIACAQDAPPTYPVPGIERAPTYPVVRVIDARCVSLLTRGGEQKIALSSVLAPENQTARQELQHFLDNLLGGEDVFVEGDLTPTDDAKEPPPVYLFRAPDGLFVNLEIIRQGYAKAQTEADSDYAELMQYYERRARQARKGVWAPAPKTGESTESRASAERPAPRADKITVYVTNSGKKYHKKGCQHLRTSSNAISLQEAIAKGYEPCSRCKPPTLDNP